MKTLKSVSEQPGTTDDVVYHYTDTIRLPWILESGELRPSLNSIGGYPPDFLWATTDPKGDRTSAAAGETVLKLWREGHLLLIRVVLDPVDFENWESVAHASQWTRDQIEKLKRTARSLGERDTTKWRCRPYALPIASALRIEAKSFASKHWAEINQPHICISSKDTPNFRGVVIGDFAYGGVRTGAIQGAASYDPVHRFPIKVGQELLAGSENESR